MSEDRGRREREREKVNQSREEMVQNKLEKEGQSWVGKVNEWRTPTLRLMLVLGLGIYRLERERERECVCVCICV